MKKYISSFMVIAAFVSAATAQESKSTAPEMSWLSGCWEQRDEAKKRVFTEYWMPASGQAMLGMSRTVKDGKMVGYEFMRLESSPNSLVFISRPKENKDDTSFAAVKWDADHVVFENAGHDFPQRVIYRKVGGGKLAARIEG